LVEKYRLLAEKDKTRSKEAQQIKNEILSADPSNALMTHYQIALIDFQTSCREASKGNQPPEQTVKDLVAYIQRNGAKDKDNLWKLNLIISQVYFDKNKLPEALIYAEAAYQEAPSPIQPDIALAIKNIKALQVR